MTRDQIESLHRGLVAKVDKQLVDLQKQKELQKKREEEEKVEKNLRADETGTKEKGRKRTKEKANGRRG